MAIYKLAGEADYDLEGILEYTYDNFGKNKMIQYRNDLKTTMQTLAEFPHMGVKMEGFSMNLRKHEHQSHLIIYQPTEHGVYIVRILGDEMDIEEHF